MRLSQLGEFGLIKLLARQIGKPCGGVVVGVGDDAAVLQMTNDKCQMSNEIPNPKSKYLLITTDTLVENVHFKLKTTSYFNLGCRALAVNISDIAAMGGVPTYALVTVGLKGNEDSGVVKQLYKGMQRVARQHKIQIVGGDTVRSPNLIISITLLGEVERERLLLRSGAKVGDRICVTGKFGGPAAKKFLTPNAECLTKVKLSRTIAKSRLATSMIDSSDGLVRSVRELCRASRVGARINLEAVPITRGATLEQALYGGEEYELVFTIPGDKVARCFERLRKVANVSVVGEIVGKRQGVKLVDSQGKLQTPQGGFDHFK